MPSVLVIESRFYEDIGTEMLRGAVEALTAAEAPHTVVAVPGVLEIPAALAFACRAAAADGPRYDGFVALGCVIRGETSHHEHVAGQCMRGLADLGLRYTLALGNGVLTCETREQAWARARVDGRDKGGDAARAALRMIALRRRWVPSS